MKCPSCGVGKLVRDTRDISYAYKGETTTIPAVRGDFCPSGGIRHSVCKARARGISPP